MSEAEIKKAFIAWASDSAGIPLSHGMVLNLNIVSSEENAANALEEAWTDATTGIPKNDMGQDLSISGKVGIITVILRFLGEDESGRSTNISEGEKIPVMGRYDAYERYYK